VTHREFQCCSILKIDLVSGSNENIIFNPNTCHQIRYNPDVIWFQSDFRWTRKKMKSKDILPDVWGQFGRKTYTNYGVKRSILLIILILKWIISNKTTSTKSGKVSSVHHHIIVLNFCICLNVFTLHVFSSFQLNYKWICNKSDTRFLDWK
jgi:hypothetical protein